MARRLSRLLLAALLAAGAYGSTVATSVGADYTAAPLPASACRAGITGHYFTLGQARRCAPEASMIQAGQGVSKSGRYLVHAANGYSVMGFAVSKLSASGAVVDAQANSCYNGGTYRTIYSWQWYPDTQFSLYSENCVVSYQYVYNVGLSTSCNTVFAACDINKYVLGNYTAYLNPAADFVVHGPIGSATLNCRHYLDAWYNQSNWCY